MDQLRAELSAEFASAIQAFQSEDLTLLHQSTFRQQIHMHLSLARPYRHHPYIESLQSYLHVPVFIT